MLPSARAAMVAHLERPAGNPNEAGYLRLDNFPPDRTRRRRTSTALRRPLRPRAGPVATVNWASLIGPKFIASQLPVPVLVEPLEDNRRPANLVRRQLTVAIGVKRNDERIPGSTSLALATLALLLRNCGQCGQSGQYPHGRHRSNPIVSHGLHSFCD